MSILRFLNPTAHQKSKQFINGMLDKAALILQKEGKITKSGRGLIDNK